MSYEELAKLIETHKDQMAHQAAQQAIAKPLPTYARFNPEELASKIVHAFEVVARYAISGDPAEYRDNNVEIIQARLDQGHSVEEVIVMGRIIFDLIKELVNQTLPAPEDLA